MLCYNKSGKNRKKVGSFSFITILCIRIDELLVKAKEDDRPPLLTNDKNYAYDYPFFFESKTITNADSYDVICVFDIVIVFAVY
jgi:hypothetical protein